MLSRFFTYWLRGWVELFNWVCRRKEFIKGGVVGGVGVSVLLGTPYAIVYALYPFLDILWPRHDVALIVMGAWVFLVLTPALRGRDEYR